MSDITALVYDFYSSSKTIQLICLILHVMCVKFTIRVIEFAVHVGHIPRCVCGFMTRWCDSSLCVLIDKSFV